MPQESGLAKRGLVVFGVLLLLAVTLGYMIFRRSPAPQTKELPHPEPYIAALLLPAAGFPSTLHWMALGHLSERLPSPPGWQIRYNATQVLAKRGSLKLPLDTLREMLDEAQQQRNHRVQRKDGRLVTSQGDVEQVMLVGLRSLHEWLKHPEAVAAVGLDNPKLRALAVAADKLTEHSNQIIQNEASKVRLALNPK